MILSVKREEGKGFEILKYIMQFFTEIGLKKVFLSISFLKQIKHRWSAPIITPSRIQQVKKI